MNLGKKEAIKSILISGILPAILYTFLSKHYSELVSLIIVTLIPAIYNIYEIIKAKKIDVFAAFMLSGYIVACIVTLLGGGSQFLLLKGSLITGAMGLIFLISLILFPKPLIYYFVERFSDNDKEKSKKLWEKASFRKRIRTMTLVWGLSLIFEAIVKVILVYTISVTTFLFISEFVTIGIIGLTILWQVKYVKKIKAQTVK